MLDKLIGKDGLLWQTGRGDEGEPPPAPAPTQASSTPAASLATTGIDAEALAATRKATFEIPGSIFVRFMTELSKLEDVIPDRSMRIKAVIKMLGVSPGDLVTALTTTHTAALTAWKGTVATARKQGHDEKVGGRNQELSRLDAADERLREEIAERQRQIEANGQRRSTLRGEIAQAEAEIATKTGNYDAAIAATERELGETIATLRAIT